MRKKQVVVVKALRESRSPTRSLLVSRSLSDAEDVDVFTTSELGNSSPKKPVFERNGAVLERSILGDPKAFAEIESKAQAEIAVAASNMIAYTRDDSDAKSSTRRKVLKPQKVPQPATDVPIIDLVEHPKAYLSKLRSLQDTMNSVRTKTLERSSSLVKFLPIYEQTSLNREATILANWQERQKEWERIQSDIGRRINAPKNHALMMSKTDEYRARTEEYEFLRASVPGNDRRKSENVFEWTLRDNSVRAVPVGHMFTGLYTEVTDVIKTPVIIRKAKPMGDLLSRTNPAKGKVVFFEETSAMIAQKKKYGRNLLALRPREISLEDASGLWVKSEDLFEWAINSAEDYFEVTEAIKNKSKAAQRGRLEARRSSFGGVFDRKRDKTPDKLRSASSSRRGSRRGSRTSSRNGSRRGSVGAANFAKEEHSVEGPKVLFMSHDEMVFSSNIGDILYKAATFKNTGTVAFTYEWSVVKDDEARDPPEVSTISELLGRTDLKDMLSREHFLSAERSPIYCMKAKGIILPGEIVRTLFSFSPRGTAGAVTEAWALDTHPRANIAIDPLVLNAEATLQAKANKLHPMLLSALAATATVFQSQEPEYDSLTPLQLIVRGHVKEVDGSILSRQSVSTSVEKDVLKTIETDGIVLAKRKLREPVKIGHINQRKIKLFEKINCDIFHNLGGTFGSSMPVVVTTDRIGLFESICDDVNTLGRKVSMRIEDLRIAGETTNTLSGDRGEGEEKEGEGEGEGDRSAQKSKSKAFAVTNRDLKQLRKMALEIFPERVIEPYDEVVWGDIQPLWDFNIESLMEAANSHVRTARDIAAVEKAIRDGLLIASKEAVKEAKRVARAAQSDAEDDEEEEEEEEEQEEQGTEENKITLEHPTVIESEALLAKCSGTLNLLLTKVLPVEFISPSAKDALCSTCDHFDDFHTTALAAATQCATTSYSTTLPTITSAGIAETPSPRPLHIPQIPSPFSTLEGMGLWTQILESIPLVDTPLKKSEKQKKGSAEELERERESKLAQVHTYYRSMYEQISDALCESLERMFVKVDTHMEESCSRARERSLYAGESLLNVAVLRDEDSLGYKHPAISSEMEHLFGEERSEEQRRRGSKTVNTDVDDERGKIAFFNFDGACFVNRSSTSGGGSALLNDNSAKKESGGGEKNKSKAEDEDEDEGVLSAFDVLGTSQIAALQPIVQAAMGGISTAVLIYESQNTESSPYPYATTAARKIKEMLSSVTDDLRSKSLKYRKNKKINGMPVQECDNPIPRVAVFNVQVCLNFEDLNFRLQTIVDNYDRSTINGLQLLPGKDVSPFASVRTVVVLVLEDLRIPNIIPPEPELPILIENDEDPPLSFGLEESEALRRKEWIEKRPHRAASRECTATTAGGGAVSQAMKEEGSEGPQGIYTCVAAALSEAYSIASGRPTIGLKDSYQMDKLSEIISENSPEELGTEDFESQKATVPPALWIESCAGAFFRPDGQHTFLHAYDTAEKLPFLKNVLYGPRGADCASSSSNGDSAVNNRGSSSSRASRPGITSCQRDVPASQRVVSKEIRQTMLWIGVMQLMPLAAELLREAEEALQSDITGDTASTGEFEKEKRLKLPVEVSPAVYHFARIFHSSHCPSHTLPGPAPLLPSLSLILPSLVLPNPSTSSAPPRFKVVLGGSVRMDKFHAIDHLIDLAHTILIVGEMSLPFIILTKKVSLLRHEDAGYCDYEIVCRNLLYKARARGCHVILPVDFMTGDEAVSARMKREPYRLIDEDARDEGADYEGECRVVTVVAKEVKAMEREESTTKLIESAANAISQPSTPSRPSSSLPASKKNSLAFPKKKPSVTSKESQPAAASISSDNQPLTFIETKNSVVECLRIRDYVYDIGPRSCNKLREEIGLTDLLLVWGTVGMCEISSFQTGQRTLIHASSMKPKQALNYAEKTSGTAVTQGTAPGDCLSSRLDSRQKSPGRLDSVSSIPETPDAKSRRGRMDSVATIASDVSDLKHEAKQKRGRADSAATMQSLDLTDARSDAKLKRGSMDSLPTAPPQIIITEEPVPVGKVPRTLLIGDSTVEWFSRVLDPDGQYGGDIVGTGKVDFATRKSHLPIGLLGACKSRTLDEGLILKRLSNPLFFDSNEVTGVDNEWNYDLDKKNDDHDDDDEEGEDDE